MDLFSRFEEPRRPKKIVGEIYVLHFGRPYKHARHYIGWARAGTVEERISQHLSGRGSPLVKAVVEAGIPVTLAAVFPGTRDMERHLKNRHDNRGVCPICRKDWLEKKKGSDVKKSMTVSEVRDIVRTILTESICPVCGGRGAYVGLNDVECPNKACPKFSVKQLRAGEEEKPVGDFGGDYESWNDLELDHPAAAEQWLDIPGSNKEGDSWYEDQDGELRGYMTNARPENRDYVWIPDRGWEPS